MRVSLLAVLLGLVCLFSIPAQWSAPQEVVPGEPFTVVVRAEADISLVEVRDAAGVLVSAGRPFVLPFPSARGIACVVLALPTTAPPGGHELRALNGEGDVVRSAPLTVAPREFRREAIALSSSLTDLRTENPEARQAEAEQLREVLESFDPLAVYHLGTFSMPLAEARRTSLFGDRRRYAYADGGTAAATHNGIDLAAPEGFPIASFVGRPVMASGAGVVRVARERIVTGNTVVVEHLPGVFSLYYHLNDLLVREGDIVENGELIGTVGATGLATGPHLHWEFRVNGVAADPDIMVARPLVDFDR
jgi:hypothetical protein